MSCIYDTPVFRLSLRSLIDTLPSNTEVVVVEDGLFQEERCLKFVESLMSGQPLTYMKYPEHNSMGQMFKWVLDTYAQNWAENTIGTSELTHIILSHNDLFFPNDWWKTLDEARDKLEAAQMSSKCPVINLSHNEYAFKNYQVPDTTKYDDLFRALQPSRFYSAELSGFFGVSQDRWNMNRVGRLSPLICMTKEFFDELEFQNTGHGYDCEILWLLRSTKRWSIWINNERLLHFRPTESGNDTVLNHQMGKGADHYDWMDKNVKKCEEIFGVDLETWLDIEFGLIKQLHKEQIEDVFNNRLKQLEELDFIFEEINNSL